MAPASARARRVSGCLAGIGSEEQIAKGTAQQVCDAAPGEMVRPVVNEMAALTQASQVSSADCFLDYDRGGQPPERRGYAVCEQLLRIRAERAGRPR